MDGFLRDYFENGPGTPEGSWKDEERDRLPDYSLPQPIQSPPKESLERILSRIQGLRKDLNSVIVLEEELSRPEGPDYQLKPGEEIVRILSERVKIGSHMEEGSPYFVDRGGGDTYTLTEVDEVDDYEDITTGYHVGRTRKTKPDIEKIALAKSELKLMAQNKKWHSANYLLGFALREVGEIPYFDYFSLLNSALKDLAKRKNDVDAIEDLRVIYGIPKSTETELHHHSCYGDLSLIKIRMKAGELLGISEADLLGREGSEFRSFLNDEQRLKVYRESTIKKYRKDAASNLRMKDKHPILTVAMALAIPLAYGGLVYSLVELFAK